MFGEFPKLLGRDFAVGYLLPSTIFLAGSAYLFESYGRLPVSTIEVLVSKSPWFGAVLAGMIMWFFAIFLLAASRNIFRLKEGYGPWNHPKNPLVLLQRRRFERLKKSIKELRIEVESYQKRGESPPGIVLKKLINRSRLIVTSFPDDEVWILASVFGNTIRAFEVYPRVMYGFEAISGWPHLQAVIPKDYRDLIDGAKAHLDFWVNLWFLLLVFLAEYVCFVWLEGRFEIVWLPASAIIGVGLSSFCARQSVVHWGEMIKASFDVFLPELSKKLGFGIPTSLEEERRIWTSFSQAILYRLPESFPNRLKNY